MTAKEMYNKAYSTRRAVKSGHMTIGEHLQMWNESLKHVQVSEKANQSYVNRKRETVAWMNGLRLRKFQLHK